MHQRICVVGLAKSGTSALYSAIKAKLAEPRRLMFEPASKGELAYVAQYQDGNALTKMMFTSLRSLGYDPAQFTHNVAIVRDPRDIIISTILFQFNKLRILNDKELYGNLVNVLERKEQNPRDVSIVEILETSGEGRSTEFRDEFASVLKRFAAFIDENGHNVLAYDDMVTGNLSSLAAYLGLPIEKPHGLDGWISKISRKGESGDWKHWFCSSDIEFFSSSLTPFMQRFGIPEDWTLATEPLIEPEHCSEYIKRLETSRRTDPNRQVLKAKDEKVLLSAVEDGKVNAINNLIEFYNESNIAGSDEKIAGLNEILGQMGFPKPAVLAARYFLKKGDRPRALKSFRNGVDHNYLPALRGLGLKFINAKSADVRAEALAALVAGAGRGDDRCIEALKLAQSD